MGDRSANQLRLGWGGKQEELPEAVREDVQALLAQFLRVVVEAQRADEESDGE